MTELPDRLAGILDAQATAPGDRPFPFDDRDPRAFEDGCNEMLGLAVAARF